VVADVLRRHCGDCARQATAAKTASISIVFVVEGHG